MHKTSVYLDEAERALLNLLSEVSGKSQSEVIREALRAYRAETLPPREFAIFNSGEGDGRSVADIPDDELLAGLGEQ